MSLGLRGVGRPKTGLRKYLFDFTTWWARSRLRRKGSQALRAWIQSPGPALAFLAVFVSLWTWLDDRADDLFGVSFTLFGLPFDQLLLVLVVLPLAMWAAASLSLRAMHPSAYADAMIAGRPDHEVFYVIAAHIKRECSAFVHVTEAHELVGELTRHAMFIEQQANGNVGAAHVEELSGILKNEDSVDRLIRALGSLLVRQQVRLHRIDTLKHVAAERMDIDPRRFCDHILQYSARVHRDRTEKYVRNWEDIHDLMAILGHPDDSARTKAARRIVELTIQNSRIREDAEARIEEQDLLVKYDDLHQSIHELASMHSTSGSILTYAKVITRIARQQRPAVQSRADGRDGRGTPIYRCTSQLKFLYRKQRAHFGLDLNSTLIRLVSSMAHSASARGDHELEERFERQRLFLERLERNGRNKRAVLYDGRRLGLRQKQDHAMRTLIALEHIAHDVVGHVEKCRDTIVQYFVDFLSNWPETGRLYIVSHGYSSTVRDLIQRGLFQRAQDCARQRFQVRNLTDVPLEEWEDFVEELPRVYFIRDFEEDSIDTQMMEYELREDRDRRGFGHLAVGPQEMLSSLVDDGDNVLVILGLECFDKNHRIVHPRGLEGLHDLVKGFRNRKVPCAVVGVGEEYKYVKGTLADTELADDHLDRLRVYDPKIIDTILSEESNPHGTRGDLADKLTNALS